MRVFVFVNDVKEIGPRQTTALLIAAFYRLGFEVFLSNVDGMSISNSSTLRIFSNSKQVELGVTNPSSHQIADFSAGLESSELQPVEIQPRDLIFIRTNPGRDLQRRHLHSTFLDFCQVAKTAGIRVINDPVSLSFFASKAAVATLPVRYRPEILVTQDLDLAATFIRDSKCDCVVKPLMGSRGNKVIRVNAANKTLELDLAQNFRDQSFVVQHFIETKEPGDKRVVVLNGEVLKHESHVAGIHRLPAEGDFRANLHAGGSAHELKLTSSELAVVEYVAAALFEEGIQLAGIDIVGSKVIEFNVFSTGGLYDSNEFSRIDFSDKVAKSLSSCP